MENTSAGCAFDLQFSRVNERSSAAHVAWRRGNDLPRVWPRDAHDPDRAKYSRLPAPACRRILSRRRRKCWKTGIWDKKGPGQLRGGITAIRRRNSGGNIVQTQGSQTGTEARATAATFLRLMTWRCTRKIHDTKRRKRCRFPTDVERRFLPLARTRRSWLISGNFRLWRELLRLRRAEPSAAAWRRCLKKSPDVI